jgi:UDP-3-O-[3-hydroxymyristoyl] glucosamine N-acyltransferase
VATLLHAREGDVGFLTNDRYRADAGITRATAVLVAPSHVDWVSTESWRVVLKDPYRAYGQWLTVQCGAAPRPLVSVPLQVSTTGAYVASSASVAGAVLGVGSVVGAHARIGPGSVVEPYAVIGDGVVIGSDCFVGSHSTIYVTEMGDRVTIHPGCRIGQDGFGFAMGRPHQKIPQLGWVTIGSDVEIGAGTCIDRGALDDTVIGSGTKIDNLVQIGHNVRIGEGCVLVAMTGIAGSTVLGHGVVTGGQSGFAGHLTIGDGAQFAAQSGVIGDVAAGMTLGGTPAIAMPQWLRQMAWLRRMVRQGADGTNTKESMQ